MNQQVDLLTPIEPAAGQTGWLDRFAQMLGQLPRVHVLLLAAALVLAIAAIDYLTGYEMDVAVFYVAPVALATWYAGRSRGIGISVFACLTQALVNIVPGHTIGSFGLLFWNALVQLSFFLITAILLAELHKRLRMEQHLSRTDGVTGMLNFRAFRHRLDYSIALTRRDNRPLTLAYFDMDNFKLVNDKYGHAEGDRLLRSLGDALTHFTRSSDTVARIGGDEFAILLPATGAAGAQEVLGKLLEALSALRAGSTPITCSVGAVTFEQPPEDADEAIRAADGLMYKVKYSG